MNKRINETVACLLAAGFLTIGTHEAMAFSNANADTLFNNYNNAFYSGSGNASYKNYKSGGDTGFWQQAEEIEATIDAAVRNSTYTSMVSALISGFDGIRGTSWSYNTYNDDVMWACIAHLRAYNLTGNTTDLNTAKANFDMAYARSYDTVNGGFYWTSANSSKNSAVNGPASIVAYRLYVALGDSTYLTKAQNITAWQRSNCFNGTTGQVYDSPGDQTPTTYNQGTFLEACDNLGQTGGATLACNYLMTMGSTSSNPSSSGYNLMPVYGLANNNSGFNSIGIRWATAYMKHRGLQSSYQAWLQANANCAWAVTRTSDGLSWENWHLVCTNGAYVGSWDCVSSVAALQDVPPTQ